VLEDWPSTATSPEQLRLTALPQIEYHVAQHLRAARVTVPNEYPSSTPLAYGRARGVSYDAGSLLLCRTDYDEMALAIPITSGVWQPMVSTSRLNPGWVTLLAADAIQLLGCSRLDRISTACATAIRSLRDTQVSRYPWALVDPHDMHAAEPLSRQLQTVLNDCQQSQRGAQQLTTGENIARSLRAWVQEQAIAYDVSTDNIQRTVVEMLAEATPAQQPSDSDTFAEEASRDGTMRGRHIPVTGSDLVDRVQQTATALQRLCRNIRQGGTATRIQTSVANSLRTYVLSEEFSAFTLPLDDDADTQATPDAAEAQESIAQDMRETYKHYCRNIEMTFTERPDQDESDVH